MSTSARKPKGQPKGSRPAQSRSFVPTCALAQTVEFDDTMMQVSLTDGRVLSVPLIWFPILQAATPQQRTRWEIGGGGISLHWPELDEDLSIAGLLAGADSRSA